MGLISVFSFMCAVLVVFAVFPFILHGVFHDGPAPVGMTTDPVDAVAQSPQPN